MLTFHKFVVQCQLFGYVATGLDRRLEVGWTEYDYMLARLEQRKVERHFGQLQWTHGLEKVSMNWWPNFVPILFRAIRTTSKPHS